MRSKKADGDSSAFLRRLRAAVEQQQQREQAEQAKGKAHPASSDAEADAPDTGEASPPDDGLAD